MQEVGHTTSKAAPSFALVTAPVAASAPAPLALVAPPLPSVVNRDTVTHGLIAAGSVAGVGALTLIAGGSTLSLIAAALAAGVTTAIAAVRFLGTGGAAQRQILAHMASERAALNAATQTINSQLSALADDRQQLAADRSELASERHTLAQRVADEAQRLVAPLRSEVETERQKLASERQALDAWAAAQGTPNVEAARLSSEELAAITAAIAAYNVSSNNLPHRFVAQLYVGDDVVSTAAQRMIPNELVVATLVGMGKVYAGAASQCPEGKFVVRAEAATTIGSVAQLREFLRLATGKTI